MQDKNTQTRLLVYYENGEKITCEEKFEFYSEETKKNYIVYADTKPDEEGFIRVSAYIYEEVDKPSDTEGGLATIIEYDEQGNPISKVIRTYPIETEREWRIIEAIVEALQN